MHTYIDIGSIFTIFYLISVLTYNCNNAVYLFIEKFIEPNELSILICQICYKTNSNVLLNYFLMGNLGLVLFHQRVNFWCYAGGRHS